MTDPRAQPARADCDRAMTWSEAILWILGGAITLGAGLVDGESFVAPWYLRAVGAFGMVVGGALWIAWRRGGAPRPVLGALAYLGTALITTAVVAGGEGGEVFVPLYGFVAVVAAMHMPQAVAVRHVALIVVSTGLLVALDGLSPARAWILLLVVLVMAAVVSELARQQLETLEEQARQEQWRSSMVDALAHDLRSPLTLVQGVVATLRRSGDLLDDEGRDQLLDAAARHAARMERLTNDLLAAERVRHGHLRLDRRELDVAQLVHEVLHDHGVSVPVSVDVEPGLVLAADRDRVVQMLHNLLTNAVAHGEPPVLVTASSRDGQVVLSVRDHGGGVSAELRDTLFGRFAGGRSPDSVGLGLWIVRTLCEAHGGRVTYEDASPGARFQLWFPSQRQAAPAPVQRLDVGPARG